MRVLLALFLSTVLALPVAAETRTGPPQVGFELPPEFAPARKNPAGVVKLGGQAISFETTKLSVVATSVKVLVGERSDARSSLHWLCLNQGGQRVWLTSDQTASGKINGVVLARIPVSDKGDASCKAAPASAAKITLPNGIALGMAEADLRKALGAPSLDRRGVLAWVHSAQTPEGSRTTATLWARIEGGAVSALDLGQSTEF